MANALEPLRQNPAPREDVSNRQLWSLLGRNRFLLLLSFVLTPALSYLLASLVTPVYRASSTLSIEKPQRLLDPLSAIPAASFSDADIAAELELLNSRTLAEESADSLAMHVRVSVPYGFAGTAGLISASRPLPRSAVFAAMVAPRTVVPQHLVFTRLGPKQFSVKDAPTSRPLGLARVGEPFASGGLGITLAPSAGEHASFDVHVTSFAEGVGALRASLSVIRPSRESNTVAVSFESTDPELARLVPNTLGRHFITLRGSIVKSEARSRVMLLRQQRDTLATQLTTAEDAVVRFRRGGRGVSSAQQVSADANELSRSQSTLTVKRAELAQVTQALADARRNQAAGVASGASSYWRLAAIPGLQSALSARLSVLAESESQRKLLLTRRAPADPEVRALVQKAVDIEAQIDLAAQSYQRGAEREVAAMEQSASQIKERLNETPVADIELSRLERQNKLIESLFLTVQSRLKEAEIVAAIDDSRLRMLDSADTPDSPVRPVPDQYVKIGIFIGLLIGIALALLREMLDRSVHTQEDMQQMTASVSLGVIPHIRSSDAGAWRALVGLRSDAAGSPDSHASDRIVTVRDPGNPIAEAYRALRTNLTFARSDETPEVVVFTSPTPRDGKTTTTANLAIVLAYQRLRVLLIDADLRRGSVHRIFDIPSEPGLSNLLIGGTRVSDAVRTLEISTGITLDILPLGGTPPNPAELLGSDRMEQLISEFRKVYDIVIFDSPPVNLVTDAAILGAKADGVVLVGRANYTERAAVAFATDQLRQVRARMLGFVLNDFVFRRDYRYSSGGAYEYYDSDRYARRYANADGDDHVGRLPWWKRLLGRTAE